MSVTVNFSWAQDCGAVNTGHGTSRSGMGGTNPPLNQNWKAIDDAQTAVGGTPYSSPSAVIVAGQNSMSLYQFGYFSGTFDSVLNVKWSPNTTTTLGTGLDLKATVTSTYAQPAQATNTALTTDFGTPVTVGSGLAVLLGGDPSTAAAATLSAPGYTQYLVSQLQTTSSAAAGDMSSITGQISFDSN